jgi:membrane-bound lytic murein transglycosylase A
MRSVWGWLAALALAACAGPTSPAGTPPVLGLTPVAFTDVPGWQQDHLSAAMTALRRECAVIATLPADTELGGEVPATRPGGRAGDWRPLCAATAAVAPGDEAGARAVLERTLQPYAINDNGQAEGLFTGYYEPEVAGAMRRGGRYQTPLLRRPADLVRVDLGDFSRDLKGHTIEGRVSGPRLMPYYDRAGIEAGALDGQKLALMYLADPIDAFFLQIQGSGRVRTADGQIVRVTYDAQNGRPYVPIGRLLVERGALARDKVSMQSIRAWLEGHPDQAQALMDANPSYVFFRRIPGLPANEGAPGALHVPLTPERSLAVDRRFIPLAAPVFVATSDPLDGAPWQHLLLAQDIGGAIKGPVRGDIFFGWGADAERLAGTMQQKGAAYLLLPRTAPGV